MNATLGYKTTEIKRIQHQKTSIEQDQVVEEYPIAFVYNGISHAVMMATPKDIEVFAIGFSLSEGIVDHFNEIYAIDVLPTEYGISVEIEISSRALHQLKEKRRVLVGRTGCGLCGIESLQQLQLQSDRVISHMVQPQWFEQIPTVISELKKQQYINQITGAAHAAAWVENEEIQHVFEDVGRHNALDKLLGYVAQHGIDVSLGFVIMTSRASYELVKKCAQLNIALLACISAPTSLAIELAQQSKLTLVGFCRNQNFVLYT